MEKCRQAQLSNFALALVFYVFDKTSGMNRLQCNDQSAELLVKLYGIDPGSIKKILCVIYGKKDSLLDEQRNANKINSDLVSAINQLTGKVNSFNEKLEKQKILPPTTDMKPVQEIIKKE